MPIVWRTASQTGEEEKEAAKPKAQKAIEKIGEAAGQGFDKHRAADTKVDIKKGNVRIDPTQFGALGSSMATYDPRKGSGMYSGGQQFVRANVPQAARSANVAYDVNEQTADDVTFESALERRKGEGLGRYDRALLSGFEGPSQERESVTRAEAKERLESRFGALGESMSKGKVWDAISSQVGEGVDEAKAKYVADRMAAYTNKLQAQQAQAEEQMAALRAAQEASQAQLQRSINEGMIAQMPDLNQDKLQRAVGGDATKMREIVADYNRLQELKKRQKAALYNRYSGKWGTKERQEYADLTNKMKRYQ